MAGSAACRSFGSETQLCLCSCGTMAERSVGSRLLSFFSTGQPSFSGAQAWSSWGTETSSTQERLPSATGLWILCSSTHPDRATRRSDFVGMWVERRTSVRFLLRPAPCRGVTCSGGCKATRFNSGESSWSIHRERCASPMPPALLETTRNRRRCWRRCRDPARRRQRPDAEKCW